MVDLQVDAGRDERMIQERQPWKAQVIVNASMVLVPGCNSYKNVVEVVPIDR